MHTNEIVEQVIAAQQDIELADALIKQYMPFIKSETAKFIKRTPVEEDDELSISMFAFYEAIKSYKKMRGVFLNYAALVIRHRLLDYYRKEQKSRKVISLDAPRDVEEDITLIDTLRSDEDIENELGDREATKAEIELFVKDLAEFGLTLTEVAENCPKQERTVQTCYEALNYARENPEILRELVATKKLPISKLSRNSVSVKKKLERHRKYMVAILLAYTNGFEIIRGHLCQIGPKKGDDICSI